MGECLILRSGGMDTSDATATAEQILAGYTAYVNDELITGTMVDNVKINIVIGKDETYEVPSGFYSDGIAVKVSSLEDNTPASATDVDILDGYTAWVSGSKITGSMVNNGAINQLLNPGGSYTIPSGYHNGQGQVSVSTLSANTPGNATAGKIISDYTAWVNGSKITGSMTNRGTVSQSLAANGSYTILSGWHNGSGKVTQSLTTQAAATITPGTSAKTAVAAGRWTTGTITVAGSSSLVAGNIKKGVSIFGVTGTYVGWVDNPVVIWNGSSAAYGCSVSWSGGSGKFRRSNVIDNNRITWYGGRARNYVDFDIAAPTMTITLTKIMVDVYLYGSASDDEGINGFTISLIIGSIPGSSKTITSSMCWGGASDDNIFLAGTYSVTDSTVLSNINSLLAQRLTSNIIMIRGQSSSGDNPSVQFAVRRVELWH